MGTRGVMGFVVGGEEKLAYNHFDSYPSGLGLTMLKWLKDCDLAQTVAQVRALRVVTDQEPPTAEDIERLSSFADTRVSTRNLAEWYVLLRNTQGEPAMTLLAGVIEDGKTFPFDSLFCEWGYVVDFDRAVFQVYQGFQHGPHDEENGRWRASRLPAGFQPEEGGYYPIKLVAEWSLERLPSDEELCALEGDDE